MRHNQADLGITAAVAVLACAAVAVGAPVAITAVLGLALFAAPGYLLARLLLGTQSTGLEFVAVATGLAFCVPVVGGLLLYAAGLPVHRAAWLGLLAGLTLAGDATVFVRRRHGGSPALDQRQPGWWRPPAGAAVGFGAAAVIAAGAVGLARAGVAMQHDPGYTQLSLHRPVTNGPTVNLGVSNDEGRTVQYRLVLAENGHPAATWNLTLANGQSWHRSAPYPSTISASLFRLPDVTQPYRHVTLHGSGTP